MSSLRITGGFLRGRKVPVPGHDHRPTSSKARQAFFNILGDAIDGASFLDLFAGSGVFALEAGSRGASRVVAVDQSSDAMRDLQALAREWKLPIQTVTADAITALKRLMPEGPFHIVYADPPYEYPRYADLLRTIAALPLAPGAVVGIEHQARNRQLATASAATLSFRKTASYGNVAISIFDRTAPE
jgi:16S rRNA (guanine966-N2)-methyltransferase